MAAKVTDNLETLVFQTTMAPRMTRQNKTDYTVFEGAYDNDNVSVDFDFRVKYNYVKKHPADLIKNDHIILQNQKGAFFFLFQADKTLFKEGEDGSMVYEEDGSTGDYQYRISLTTKKPEPVPEAIKTEKQGWSGDISADVSAILEKYGLSEKQEGYSPVTEYMKKWSLEHPENEWDIHGDKEQG